MIRLIFRRLVFFFILFFSFQFSCLSQNRTNSKKIQKVNINPISHGINSTEDLISFLRTKHEISTLNWTILQEKTDELGFRHSKLQQTHNGTPVHGGQIILHFNKRGLYKVNGQLSLVSEINNKIILTDSSAVEIVKKEFPSKLYNNESEPNKVEKWVYLDENTAPIYIYKIDIYSAKPLFRYDVFIDTETGKIVGKRNKIHKNDVPSSGTTFYHGVRYFTTDSISENYYRLKNDIGGGIHTWNYNFGYLASGKTDFFDVDNNWTSILNNDQVARDVHWGAEQAYHYFSENHSFQSYDNSNAEITCNVHYNQGVNNAFWDGSSLTFGDGDGTLYNPFTSIDIVGHELTHGVIQHTANLEYLNESGALNESFADIFGCAIRFYADSANANYLVGDIVSLSGTPLRSLENPNSRHDPAYYHGNYWYSGSFDNGGVHTNSSVQNKWFYLLAEGETNINEVGVSYNITGIGLEKAAKIAFRNLSIYLTQYSDYSDARDGAIQAAKDLYGDCSFEVKQTTNAWSAVGVGTSFENSPTSVFSMSEPFSCEVPYTVNFTNLSTGADSYSWSFGDGTNSNQVSPSHTYTSAGVYDVTLISNGTDSCGLGSDTVLLSNIIQIDQIQTPAVATVCNSDFESVSTFTQIHHFSLGDIDHQSSSINDSIGDFTCQFSTELLEGQWYDLTFLNNGALKHIWIDFDNDGSFQGDEKIYSSNNNAILQNQILIDHSDIIYSTPLHMRIISATSSSTFSACSNLQSGQQFEYTTTIIQNTQQPVSNFQTLGSVVIPIGQNISFQDLSSNLPTSWHWTFQGANNPTSTAQNPTNISYSFPGSYDVTLITSNSYGSDTLTFHDYIHVGNSYNMCSTSETNQLHGILYDSGGPTNNYQNDEDCSFLIASNCAEITLNFDSVGLDLNYDFLSIYQGYDNSGTLLYQTSENTAPTPVSVIGGPIFIEFNSGENYTNFGWKLEWTSVAPTINPTANFIIPDTVEFNTSINFVDNSSNLVQYWEWDFGDGTYSTDQYPTKSYSNSGPHTVRLIVDNCFALDTITKTIIVDNPPTFFTYSDTINTELNCGSTTNVNFTIYNHGSGNLYLNAESYAPQIHHPQLMLFTVGADLSDELLKMRNLLIDSFPTASIAEFDTVHVENFATMLEGKDILIIPEIDELADSLITPFQTLGPLMSDLVPPLQEFVLNGGHVIMSANWKNRLSSFGLLSSVESNFYTGENLSVNIQNPTHEWFNDISTPLYSNKRIATQNIVNPEYISLAGYNQQTVLGYMPYGEGLVNYFGYDFESENMHNNVLSTYINVMEQKFNGSHLMVDTNVIIASGDSLVLNIEVDGYGLENGTYIDSFLVTSNDISIGTQHFYVEYTINHDLNMGLSAEIVDFDTVFQGTLHLDSIQIINHSCDTLVVDSIVSSNPLFTINATDFIIYPYSLEQLKIEFSAPNIGAYSDTIIIYNNDSIHHVLLNAVTKGSPILNIIPDSISASITSCGDSITIPFSLYNSGEGPLDGYIYDFTYLNDSLSLPFFDSFEDGDYDNWITLGPDLEVSSNKGSHGIQSLKINGITNNISRLVPESNPTYYSVKFQQDYYHTATSTIYLGNNSDSQGIFKIWKEKHKLYFNTTFHSFNISNHGAWTHIEIKNIDYFNHTFDVYINGNLEMVNVPFNNNSTDNVTITRLSKSISHPGISCYFDEIILGHQSTINLINLNNDSINLLPGDTQQFEITIFSEGLQAGDYSFLLELDVHLPLQDELLFPFELTLQGASEIGSPTSCLNFDTLFQQEIKTSDTIWITNRGCDTLQVTNIEHSSPFYTNSSDSFSVIPFDSVPFLVTIQDSIIGENIDTITFQTNDLESLSICLKAEIIGAPKISISIPNPLQIVNNCSLDSIIFPYTIYNNGLSNLEIHNGVHSLEEVINNLNLNNSSILASIPSIFPFTGGESGYSIYDGGNDMFNTGNILNTNLKDSIHYSDNTILSAPDAFGPNGKYFTVKYNGLFVLAADLDSIDQFSTSGSLGALGMGNMASGVINLNHGGREYTGFYKKVYDSTDPSVNHLIIVEKDPNLSHQLPYYTSSDSDIINGLKNSKRLYYLLFAGDDSHEYLDSDFNNIMISFLNEANHTNLVTNIIEPGDSLNSEFKVSPNSFVVGLNNLNVPIFNNDPVNNPYILPLQVSILTPPCIVNISDSLVGCGGSVNFDLEHANYASSILWDFGDGSTGAGISISHNYSAEGNYPVKAITCNSNGCDTFTYNLEIPPITGPIAAISTPSSQYDHTVHGITNVQFNMISNSSLATAEGYQNFVCSDSTVLYTGETYNLNIVSASSNSAMYAKAWLDFNNDGFFGVNEIILDIENQASPFIESFTTPSNGIEMNTPLRLRVAVDRNFSIFDNNPSSITYGEFEDYTVIIRDELLGPESYFSYIDDDICDGIIQFTDASTNLPSSWFWDFGDGNTSTLQNPIHEYDTVGTMVVKLTSSNATGVDSTNHYIELKMAQAKIEVGTISGLSTPIQFSNASSSLYVYDWDFDNGSSSNQASPSNTFHNPGIYVVTLQVENTYGCTDSDSVKIDLSEFIGLEELNEKIIVYPNPAKDILYILNETLQEIEEIKIINSVGQTVMVHSPNQVGNKIEINIENLVRGLYNIHYKFKDNSTTNSKLTVE